jgi:23S rRNA pseudouridine2604 synthase
MQRAATLFARYPLTTHPRLCLYHRLLSSNAASGSTNDSLAEAAPVRINNLMSSRDMCSRREADRLVAAGKVFVDGEMVASAGLKVHPVAQITIAGMDDPLYCRLGGFTVVLHKPCGFVSNQAEHGHTPAMSLLTSANRAPHCRLPLPEGVAKRMGAAIPTKGGSKGLAPLGRLDLDSSGLLIFSNNGVLAKKLIGSNNVEKEYEVVVARRRRKKKQHSQQGRDHNRREHWRTMDHDREHLREITNGRGVVDMEHALAILNGGMLQLDQKLLRPAVVERRVGTPLEGMEFLQEPTAQTWTFVLTEGRKRQIRRMCDLVGWQATAIKRVRIGNLRLGGLNIGNWATLPEASVKGLFQPQKLGAAHLHSTTPPRSL